MTAWTALPRLKDRPRPLMSSTRHQVALASAYSQVPLPYCILHTDLCALNVLCACLSALVCNPCVQSMCAILDTARKPAIMLTISPHAPDSGTKLQEQVLEEEQGELIRLRIKAACVSAPTVWQEVWWRLQFEQFTCQCIHAQHLPLLPHTHRCRAGRR